MTGLIFFYFNDLLRNGMTSWWWRYLMFIGPGIVLVMTSLLHKKIQNLSLPHVVCYLGLTFIGISSIAAIAGARHWHIGSQMNVYLENARLISKSAQPLLITDLPDNRHLIDLMVVLRECNPDNIDILRVSPEIDGVENRINQLAYSDIFVLYASAELTGNLESQFDGKMVKQNIEGISDIWKISVE